jgi:molybdopterin molybdotransferase
MTWDEELLDVSVARRRLLDHFSPLEVIQIPVNAAAGFVLAEPVVAPFDLPLFANSSMDGFAVRSKDVAQANQGHPAILRVVGDIPAGIIADRDLRSGEAMRIMTGAAIPEGADAVVPIEDTDFEARQGGTEAPEAVRIFRPARVGENIRPVGQDVARGEVVIPAGRRIRPQEAGLLCMLGQATVRVHRRPRVAIFSSGDELTPVDQPLRPGKIYDSNSVMLADLVEQCGGEVVPLGIVPDRLDAIHTVLSQAADAGIDLIVSSAGVSVGALDYVRTAIEQNGALVFWRVNMRPGKPLAFGHFRGIPFAGLPGNPVSAFIGFEVFLRPVLMKMLGAGDVSRPTVKARLQEPVESDGRESYLRAIANWQEGEWTVRLTGHQGSGNLRSLVQANALLLIPSGVKYVPTGAQVEVWFLGD